MVKGGAHIGPHSKRLRTAPFFHHEMQGQRLPRINPRRKNRAVTSVLKFRPSIEGLEKQPGLHALLQAVEDHLQGMRSPITLRRAVAQLQHKGIADLHPVGGTGQFKVEVQPFFRAKLLRHRLTQQLIAPPGDPFRQRRQVALVDLPADPGKNGRIVKGLPIAGIDGVQSAESAQNGAYVARVAVRIPARQRGDLHAPVQVAAAV